MARPVRLTPLKVTIAAPRELVFQLMSSFDGGRLKGDSSASSKVLHSSGDQVVAEFKTRAGWLTVTTVERITLDPPRSLSFEHIKGPFRYAKEMIVLTETHRGTTLEHSGEFVWFGFPVLGRLAGQILLKRAFERVLEHPRRADQGRQRGACPT